MYDRILTLSWRRSLSYRNQSIDLQSKSMNWFLYDRDLRHERVNTFLWISKIWLSDQFPPYVPFWPFTKNRRKKLRHRCFLVNFAKFIRTSSLQNTSWVLFLHSQQNWRKDIEINFMVVFLLNINSPYFCCTFMKTFVFFIWNFWHFLNANS